MCVHWLNSHKFVQQGQKRGSNVLTNTLCLFFQDSPCIRGLHFLCYAGSQQAPATLPPPDIRTGNTDIHRTLGYAVTAKISRLVLNHRVSTLNHSATSPFPKSSIYKTQIIVRLTKYYLLYYLCILTYYLTIYTVLLEDYINPENSFKAALSILRLTRTVLCL